MAGRKRVVGVQREEKEVQEGREKIGCAEVQAERGKMRENAKRQKGKKDKKRCGLCEEETGSVQVVEERQAGGMRGEVVARQACRHSVCEVHGV